MDKNIIESALAAGIGATALRKKIRSVVTEADGGALQLREIMKPKKTYPKKQPVGKFGPPKQRTDSEVPDPSPPKPKREPRYNVLTKKIQ